MRGHCIAMAIGWLVPQVSGQMGWAVLPATPTNVFHGTVAYDSDRDRLIGLSALGCFEFDGATWTAVASPSSNLARNGWLVYDPVRRITVNYARNLAARETWEWDGVTWSRRDTASPEFEHIAFHDGIARVVGFGGGFTNNFPSSNLYEWDGSAWTLVPTTNMPPRGSCSGPNSYVLYHTMAYDARRDRLCLFGATCSHGTTGSMFVTNWEWDAATGWNQVTVPGATVPGRRLWFDSHRGVLTLLAGDPLQTYERDEVGGWLPLAGGPPSTGYDLAYDSLRGRALSSRFNPTTGWTDLWAFRNTNPAPFDRHGAGCTGPSGAPAPDLQLSEPWARSWWNGPWPFSVDLVDMPGAAGMLAMGFSDQQYAGLPLPIDLAGLGMTGCMLRIAAEATQFVAVTGGAATVTLPLPADPGLLGVVYFLQGFALAPGANPAGALATPSYRGVVGQWR